MGGVHRSRCSAVRSQAWTPLHSASRTLSSRIAVAWLDGEWLGTWHPVSVWRGLEAEAPLLAHPAIALLCVAGSEAAVERSFSAQDTVMTKKRNRLSDQSVQDEMFIRFNMSVVNDDQPERKSRVQGGSLCCADS